ncbi:hypothetical protein ACHAXT_009330 [Thalassiosira profunda]
MPPACLRAALLAAHAIAAGAFLHVAPRPRPAPVEALRPRSSSSLRVETSSSSPAETSTNRNVVPPGVLGPPEPLRSLRVGQIVNAFRSLQYDEEAARWPFTIERVSCSPGIFHLRSFLTDSECEHIILAAKSIGMEAAGTVTKNDDTSRKKCSVAWIPSNQQDGSIIGGIVSDLVSSTVNIFLSPEVLSHPSAGAGVEDLQVLEYGTGGEFIQHHDGEPRILTVIYYVNGVAGTWFPLAQTNDGASNASSESAPKNKGHALEMADGLQPGKDGLLAKGSGDPPSRDGESNNGSIARIERGDAIAFYNYKDDGSGRLDWRALHCGLPTAEEEGAKWIANHWYRLNTLADVE